MSDTKGYEKTGTMYTKKSIEMADVKGLEKMDRTKKNTEMDGMGSKKIRMDSEEASKEKQIIQIEVDKERDCVKKFGGREVSSGECSEDRPIEVEEEREWAKEDGKANGRQTDLEEDEESECTEEALGSEASIGEYDTSKEEENSLADSAKMEDWQTGEVDSLEEYTEEQDVKKGEVKQEDSWTDQEQYSEGMNTLKLDNGEISKEANERRNTDNLVKMKKSPNKKSWQSKGEMKAGNDALCQFQQVTRDEDKHTETKKNERKLELAPNKKRIEVNREYHGGKKHVGQRKTVGLRPKVPSQKKKSKKVEERSKMSRQGGTAAKELPEISRKGNIKEAGARKRKYEMMEYVQRRPLPLLLQNYDRIMTHEEEEKIKHWVCCMYAIFIVNVVSIRYCLKDKRGCKPRKLY